MAEPYRAVPLLAIEGLWGVGKTTVARQVAALLGGIYAKPLQGPVTAEILEEIRRGAPAAAARAARAAVNQCLAPCLARGVPVVCDRHWLSICALTPESCWSEWDPRPPTVLLTADPAECERRLAARGHRVLDRAGYLRHAAHLLELGRRLGAAIVPNPPGRAAATAAAIVHFAAQFRAVKTQQNHECTDYAHP